MPRGQDANLQRAKVQRYKGAKVQRGKGQWCKGAKLTAKKIRGQTSKQANKATSSLLELLVAAKNKVTDKQTNKQSDIVTS